MIARTWHGRVPTAKADAYQSLLERIGLADARYYHDDDAFLVEKEPFVAHADVVSLAMPAEG